MRLIDADKFSEDLMKLWDYSCDDGVSAIAVLKQALLALNNAPTVIQCSETSEGYPLMDLRPVEERPIRCKDCKYTVLSKDGKTLICCLTMKIGTVKPDFYCGNGEMKGGAE